jgi:hypothetical protein
VFVTSSTGNTLVVRVIATRRIGRSIGAGIAGTTLSAYVAAARFSRLAPNLSAIVAWQNAAWGTEVELTPAQALAATAAFGGILGLGYASTTALLGRRGIIPGVIYGIAFWAASEDLYRRAPQRPQRWQYAPSRAIPRFAILGAAIGAVADRRFI